MQSLLLQDDREEICSQYTEICNVKVGSSAFISKGLYMGHKIEITDTSSAADTSKVVVKFCKLTV